MLAGGLMLACKFSILLSTEKISPQLSSPVSHQSLVRCPLLDNPLLGSYLLDVNHMAVFEHAANRTRVIFVTTKNRFKWRHRISTRAAAK